MDNRTLISLFGAVHVDGNMPESHALSTVDLTAMVMEFGYCPTPDLYQALNKLTARQRGTMALRICEGLESLVGQTFKTTPRYRRFPNHTFVQEELALAAWLLSFFHRELDFDPAEYGANPFTGFQDADFGPNADYDAPFSVKLGRKTRQIRYLKVADDAFLAQKAAAMVGTLIPFSEMEKQFVIDALDESFLTTEALRTIKFREKIPLLSDYVDRDDYAEACNSVTDALRLAVHLSGPKQVSVGPSGWRWSMARTVEKEQDLSLTDNPRFNLKTSQAKYVLDVLESVLMRGNTDFETDFLRHEERWKRFAEHVNVRQYTKRNPEAVKALLDLRNGWMRSWESRYAAATTMGKIEMASKRPGTFMRRIVALWRMANPKERIGLAVRAEAVFPEVDVMKLLQLHVHLTRTIRRENRYHLLPDGKQMASKRTPERMDHLAGCLAKHLMERLEGTFEWSNTDVDGLTGTFIPAANRASSDADVRTARGDRVKMEMDDVVRFFLHWHEACDVDMSAQFFGDDLSYMGVCAYYNQRNTFYTHSGDILDGREGAAEYIDVDVAKARASGVRFILMTANVYRGNAFDTFPCFVGVMQRDGQTGQHFECSTVETKLSLDSATRRTAPALLDLETGELIFVDIHAPWAMAHNVDTRREDAFNALDYFINFGEYRASFADVMRFAGTPGGPVATREDVREDVDDILAKLAEA